MHYAERDLHEKLVMTTIELTDEQATALRAKAAAEGLTLDAWLKKLASGGAHQGKGKYKLSELMAQCDPKAPLSDQDRAWLDAPSVGREA